ncbi:MAG: hypothetical protein BWY36_00554 [Candidatus Diapherotrites archaeon ADurb.Bin253]|nr:MAG: hypothetical protein BWY36_00554 [Candidatus Diapherotrites archaeon ADurb.Bin253]
MKNKVVGWVIVGIAVVTAVVVKIFNNFLRRMIVDACTSDSDCFMYNTVVIQTWVSLAIVGVILAIGIVILSWKPKKKITAKKIKKKKRN